MGDVRFGLIGYGAWGSHHAQAIEATDGARLVAVAARSDSSREAAKTAHPGCHVYANFRELVVRGEIDVVDIVLPSDLHVEAATAALEADKHLLLEKPMALGVADCDQLIELANARKRLLAVGHELRLSSLWSKVKSLVDEGAIGEPKYALIELFRNPYRQGSQDWRYDVQRVGSWVLEEPIHFFDLARWYLATVGDPVSVFARGSSLQDGRPELLDNFSAMVRFPGDTYAVITQTLGGFEHHQTVKLTGTKGALWASWSGAKDRTRHPSFSLKHFDGQSIEEIVIDRITGEVFELEDQIAMIVAAVSRNGPLAATGVDGRWSVAMCLAAEESIRTGVSVTF